MARRRDVGRWHQLKLNVIVTATVNQHPEPSPRRTGPFAELTLGFPETVPETPKSVPQRVLSYVVDAGINKGAQFARSAADAAVGKALNYVPSEFRGSAQALANKGLDSLENKAEGAARQFARDQGVSGAGLYQSGAMNGSGLLMVGSGTAMSGMGNGRMAAGTHVVSPYNHLTAKGSY